jgi:hypothetical protein
MKVEYALSIKQPWAALLIHGVKTIEIRRWPTRRRGRVLIHAARIPDGREQGWKLVTPEIQETAKLCGGIIGAAELVRCITYRDPNAFVADQQQHLNDPDWFRPPLLYGFHFTGMERLPFRRFAGNVRFFTVPVEAKRDG